MLRLD